MGTMGWKDVYSVRVELIDTQHKELIRIFNDLGNAMLEGKGRDHVKDTLARLIDYTRFHFSAEEELMLQNDYPDYASHKKIHDELKNKVMLLNERRNDDSFVLRLEIIYFLKKWLQKHILETDRKLGVYLNSRMKKEI